MGNVFSKTNSVKDRLLHLEEKIIAYEIKLRKLQESNLTKYLYCCFSLPIFSYFFYILDYMVSLSILFSIIIHLIFFYFTSLVKGYRKQRIARALERLKAERKTVIELCKNDINFTVTKNLIEKYDEDETRETFFKQLKQNKKSALDSVADFVLGNDPSTMNALICTHCGIHNGLVDTKNDKFDYFYCYSCKNKNVRKRILSPTLNNSSIKLNNSN